MSGLEDRLLKQNIPGKYTWWDEYNGTERHEDDGDDDEEQEEGESTILPQDFPNIPSKPSSGKAGIKGVLADYKLEQEEIRRQRLIDRLEREEIVDRNTRGALLKPGEMSISASAVAMRKQQERRERESRKSEYGDDGENDDEFLERYRRQRIREMQEANLPPTFEGVEDVDPLGYSNAVDETDPRIYVVVHLYETYVPACRTLINVLQDLSRRGFPHARFLSLRASSASNSLDPVVLPSVLIHKGGRLLHNFTPFTKHVGDKMEMNNIRELFQELLTDRKQPPSKPVETSIIATAVNPTDSDDELDEFCKGFTPSLQ